MVERMIESLPEEERKIVQFLCHLIQEATPTLQEKLSYGVPYFSGKRRICFIWPSSVPLGPKAGVMLGLCKGYLLSNEQRLLQSEGRKEVYAITFHHEKEIPAPLIAEIIREAILVDQTGFKK